MIKCSCLACEEARGCRKCITAMVFAGNFRGARWIHKAARCSLVYLPSAYADRSHRLHFPEPKSCMVRFC